MPPHASTALPPCSGAVVAVVVVSLATLASTVAAAADIGAPVPTEEMASSIRTQRVFVSEELPSRIERNLGAAHIGAAFGATDSDANGVARSVAVACTGFSRIGGDFAPVAAGRSVHSVYAGIHTEALARSRCGAALRSALTVAQQRGGGAEHPALGRIADAAPLLRFILAADGALAKSVRAATTSGDAAAASGAAWGSLADALDAAGDAATAQRVRQLNVR